MVHQNDFPAKTYSDGDPTRITTSHTTAIPADLWRDLLNLQRGLDALASRLFGSNALPETVSNGQPAQAACVEPDADIYESAQDYVLHIALPGIGPEAIEVHVSAHRIALTAQAAMSLDKPDEADPEEATDPENAKQASTFVTAWQFSPIRQPNLYTRRRQGRHSVASRFAFEHTFLEEIVPEQAQAHLRHGRLDLRLPKLKTTVERSVRIVIQV